MSNVAKRYSWIDENNISDIAIDNINVVDTADEYRALLDDEYQALLDKAYEVNIDNKVLVCDYCENPDWGRYIYCLYNYYLPLSALEKELYLDIARKPLPTAPQLGIHDEALMRAVTVTQNDSYYLLDSSSTWNNTPRLEKFLSILFEDYEKGYRFPREEYWYEADVRLQEAPLSPLGEAAWEFLSRSEKGSKKGTFIDLNNKYLIAVVQRLGKTALIDTDIIYQLSWPGHYEGHLVKSPIIPKHEFESFTDPRDGEEYRTVKIGKQTWMAENYRHIPKDKGWWWKPEKWDEEYRYGYWYSQEAVNDKRFCPPGWHVPTEEEVKELLRLNGKNSLTAISSSNSWRQSINKLGFSAQPSGIIIDNDEERVSFGQGQYAKYWINTQDEAKILDIKFDRARVRGSSKIKSINPARLALSVRLVKD